MIRIIDLSLYNFKGFKEATISFTAIRTILGGPNGYGKTSIFDALEILFTGEIKRMRDYIPGHDARTLLSQEHKPLVYDTAINEIVIKATVQISDNYNVHIRRIAQQEEMKNPIDFKAFSSLQYLNVDTQSYEDVATEKCLSNLFSSLAKQYVFLNYLTQEEANRFLKCKESERKQQINSLFKTDSFDEPITRLLRTEKEVVEMSKNIQVQIENIKKDIDRLTSTVLQGDSEKYNSEFLQLFNKEFDWDKRNPQLSYESFSNVLNKDGILDQLLYFCKNAETFHLYETNNELCDIQEKDNLERLAFWLRWKEQEQLIFEYDKYVRDFRKKWDDLTLSTVYTFSLDIPLSLPETLLDSEVLQEINSQILSIKDAAKSAGNIQKAYADLIGSRNNSEKTLIGVEDELHITQCPLCGNEYNSESELITSISEFGVKLNVYLNSISQGVATSVQQLRSRINDHVVKPIDEFYKSMGIDKDIWAFYLSIDKDSTRKQYSFLSRHLPLSNVIIGTEIEIQNQIIDRITAWKASNPLMMSDNFDITILRKIYSSYGRYLLPECANELSIERKRQYLINLWNIMTSKYLDSKNVEMETLIVRYNKLNNRAKLLKKTANKIKEQKSTYLSRMVSQIETLFYIYTGRIMQDSYFGRGCYLKYNSTNSNVLFTCGSVDNDVDALYKMSSGQLVSISVAFMLTVNKLYADHPIIAIDDPVQTIDDLNLWGLMETLRHDFTDSTIILSTHERDFGILLTDKFKKMGLETEYVDMSQHHTSKSLICSAESSAREQRGCDR